MNKRYMRLKLQMLLLVILGTAVAGALGVVGLNLAMQGGSEAPFARLVVWCGQHLFGYGADEALVFYHQNIRGHRVAILNASSILFMLIAFYLSMGRFTAWLGQISAATRQVVEGSDREVELPRELSPVQEDLNEIRRILAQREDAARESEQRKDDLVAYLAHDLKTPLTSVVGYLSLLREKPEPEPELREKYTGIALEKAKRLEELISEFFDITRMDFKNGGQEPIHLSVLLEQLADEFSILFEEKALVCRTEIAPRLVVAGDPERLARVFDNVLRNAVSYSSEGGQVDVEARLADGRVEIAIRNEGLAIPEQELTSIFNKFYRLDAARSTRTGGAGLGLAIAREIVSIHGGTIRAESDGLRTSFLISLPTLKQEGERQA